MKILIVSQYYYPDPFSVSLVAEQLVKNGHDVTVLTGKPNYGYHKIVPGYEKKDYEVFNGVKIYRVNVTPRKESKLSIVKNYLSFYFNARRFVNKLDDDFDIVYSVSLSPVISISPAIKYAKKHKIKHILHCLDLWPESVVATGITKKGTLLYNFLLKWSRKLYKNVDKILVSSPSFKDYLKEVIGYDENKCLYVPQATNTYDIAKDEEAIKYDTRYMNVVYCGNVGKLQLIPQLIEAVEIAKKTIPVRVYVIGLGSLTKYLKNSIKERKLEDSIIYLGAINSEHAIKYFLNADALYLGLNKNGVVGKTIPNKMTFYMSQKKPIIAAIDGNAKEVLIKSKGAIICDETKESIAKAFVDFYARNDKEKMGKCNYSYFKKYFDNKIITTQIEEEMKKLANR